MALPYTHNQMVPVPQIDIPSLCARSLHPTSTYDEYYSIIHFVETHPYRAPELPDTAFRTLFLQCDVECDRPGCTCDKSHVRRWRNNLKFIMKCGKLHLTTEFRVVIFNQSKLPMFIDKEIADMASELLLPLPNVSNILFLGPGVFTAQEFRYPETNTTDAELAARSIRKLFPNVNDMVHHIHKAWGPSPNILSPSIPLSPLYEWTLIEYVDRLLSLQMIIPFPRNVTRLCEHLTFISVNVQYVRPRGDLPPIPIRCLRVLELFQIEDAIPWRLFETLRGVLNFESLESLLLEFVHRAETTIGFPGFSWSILFPRLSRLNVTGTAYVYSDIFGYFKDQHFDELVIVDDPIFFEKLSEHTLENVKVLRISHPTGTPFVDTYSVEMAEHLYNLQSSVEQAIIRQIRLPLPQLIAWEDLLLLDITASIADKYGLINLILQLPQLRTLVIDCFSMARADYRLTKFKDQNIAFDELGKVEKPVKSGPISEHLSRLELKAARDFDVYGFSELLSRLPNVNMVRINPEMIDRVVGMLLRDFKVTREIVFMQ